MFAIAAHIFVGISGLIINSLIGIYYSAEGLGIFSQGFSIYLLLTLLANCGIMISAQKHASQYSSDDETLAQIFSNTLAATAMVSLCIALCTYYLFSLNPGILNSDEVLNFVLLICSTIPLFALNKTMNNFMVGLRFMKVYSGIRLFRWTLIVFGILFISINNASVLKIPEVFFFTELSLFFLLVIYCRPFWGKINLSQIQLHLSFGVKNILASFVDEIGIRMPILIIGYISGNLEAGLFAYVLSFSRSILLIPQAVQKSFNPVFTKHWFNNEHQKNELNIGKVFRYNALTILPAFILLYLFYMGYTYYLMPPEYLFLHPLLGILMIGMGTIYLFGPFATFLIMTDNLNTNLFRVSISTLLHFGFIFLFIHDYGNTGVAAAISISMIINLFIMDYLYKRDINIHLFKNTFFSFRNG